MRTERKARQQSLADELQRSVSFEAIQIKELIGLMLEEAKDSLMSATGEDILRQQGAARGFSRLQDLLTKPAPKMQQSTQQE